MTSEIPVCHGSTPQHLAAYLENLAAYAREGNISFLTVGLLSPDGDTHASVGGLATKPGMVNVIGHVSCAVGSALERILRQEGDEQAEEAEQEEPAFSEQFHEVIHAAQEAGRKPSMWRMNSNTRDLIRRVAARGDYRMSLDTVAPSSYLGLDIEIDDAIINGVTELMADMEHFSTFHFRYA